MTVGILGVSCEGDTGPAGPQGPPGEQGPPGDSGDSDMDMDDGEVSEDACEDLVEGPRRFDGGTGDDVICGDDSRNRIYAGGGNDVVLAMGGNDIVHGEAGDDTLDGGSGEDELRGGDNDDVIRGGEGNDDIAGGSGDDVMEGGPGNDVFWSHVNYAAPTEADANATSNVDGSDDFIGGDGVDTVNFSMAGNSEAVTIDLAEGYTDFGMAHNDDSDTYVSIENLVGTGEADTLMGDDNDNNLSGGAGDDTIEGRGGNDVITGGAGANTVDGGDGVDTFVVVTTGDATINAPSAGTAVNFENLLAASGTGTDGADLAGINLTGDNMPNTLTGNGVANTLMGGGGNDTLIGGGGTDNLTGGEGNDIFVIAMGQGADNITDFTFPAAGVSGSVDMIHLKGFPAGSDIEAVTGQNAQIAVDGDVVVTFTNADATVNANTVTSILRAPSTFVRFID